MKRVRITRRWAGREVGTVEDFYDETLAAAIVDAQCGEFSEDEPKIVAEGDVDIVPRGIVSDRAMDEPPRGKRR
jgi:hypothetical protein